MRSCNILTATLISVLSCNTIMAQFNYDESKVPAYELPELLQMKDGTPVK
ncbi:MAG TPA: acetylxylan esterase, partial [Planctomycetes bacterium]|nr:acetylxylan esterase [Planctomycetota bacterium]